MAPTPSCSLSSPPRPQRAPCPLVWEQGQAGWASCSGTRWGHEGLRSGWGQGEGRDGPEESQEEAGGERSVTTLQSSAQPSVSTPGCPQDLLGPSLWALPSGSL